MKALTLLVVSGFSGLAAAADGAVEPAQGMPSVEHYNYAMHLDIARVIQMSEIPDTCGVVPVQMTYEDRNGERHTIEYSVIGNGCSNG